MKQRKLYILTLILFLQTIFCLTGKSQDIDYLRIFEDITPDSIPTGILIDKAIPTSHIHEFDGRDRTESSDTMIMTKKEWNKIYSELLFAHVDSVKIPLFADIRDTLDKFYKQQMVPISIVNIKYNQLKDNAITDHLMEFIDYKLHEIPNPPESPYLNLRYFSALAQPLNLNSEDFIFKLDSSLYISNTDDTIQSIDIDFGNDLLFTGLNLNSEITINRSELRDTAKLIFRLPRDSSLVCKFEISINDEENKVNPFLLMNPKIPLNATTTYNDSLYKETSYNNKRYGAGFGIWFGCETHSTEEIKKPIIILEGWDPTNERFLEDIYNETNRSWSDEDGTDYGFLPRLRDQGYDVILMNYNDGGAEIQGNAMVLREFINELHTILINNKSYNEIVIMGVSMGGLVARYALAYMESINEPHYTKLFLSMDSPQQGAYLPYAIQEIGYIGLSAILMWDKLSDDYDINVDKVTNDLYKRFSCPASQQMLVYYRPHNLIPNFPAPSPKRTQLLNEFNSFGNNGYPSNVEKMVAFSFGSGLGVDGEQRFPPGGIRYTSEGPIIIQDKNKKPIELPIILEITQRAIPNIVSENILKITLRRPTLCDILPPIFRGLCVKPIILNYTPINLSVVGTLPFESAPGSFQEMTNAFAEELNTTLGQDIDLSSVTGDCFVPTVSSLHLLNKPLYYNIKDNFTSSEFDDNYYEVNDHSITPFDAIYVETENHIHDRDGVTYTLMSRAKELIAIDDFELKDKTLDNKKVKYEAHKSITLDNVTLQNNSLLQLRAGQAITFEKDFSIEKNCTFEVEAKPYCQ